MVKHQLKISIRKDPLNKSVVVRCKGLGKLIFYSLDDECVSTIIDAALTHFQHNPKDKEDNIMKG